MITPSAPGALVISLDFELHWGVRDHVPPGSSRYEPIPLGRDRVRELTREFVDRGIRATWATVGFLFASTRQELEAVSPTERPGYARREFDPYLEPVGADEDEDPSHLAGSLVRFLADSPGQEVGSHTFSHFYCLEEGQTEAAFRADLAAAQAIAVRRGLRLTSLVFPRNQWNPEYDAAVLDAGFTCIRPPQESWGYEARVASRQTPFRRALRLAQPYLAASPTTAWAETVLPNGLCAVPASAFLRPYNRRRRAADPLRLSRLRRGLRDAAQRGRIFHLWWHPENFIFDSTENFDLLRQVLDEFSQLSDRHGMLSLAMEDVPAAIAMDRRDVQEGKKAPS